MRLLGIRAYAYLHLFEFYLRRGNFQALYEKVRNWPVSSASTRPEDVEKICYASDMACIWYWKEVLCLQRSCTTACLLKTAGVQAQLVIGAQQVPFKAHAWVEVGGVVVNDRPYTNEMYAVIERC